MTTYRTVTQKQSDTIKVFNALRDELTPHEMRALIQKMAATPPDDKTDVAAYASLVNASLSLSRIVAANDRSALIAAAMITQSGVSRPIIDTETE